MLFLLLFLVPARVPLGVPDCGVASYGVLRLKDLYGDALRQRVAIVKISQILNVMVYLLLILQNHLSRMLAIWAGTHVVLPEGLIREGRAQEALWGDFTEEAGVKLWLDFSQVRLC